MKNLEISDIKDKKVSFCIVLQVTLMGIKNILVQGVSFFKPINETLNVVIAAIALLFYLYSLQLVAGRRVCSSGKMFSLFILASIVITFLVFPQNREYMQAYYLRWIIVFFLTAYLIVKLNTLEWLQHYMLYGSYLITVAGIVYAVVVWNVGHSTMSDWSTYSMSMSNVVMWAAMWQLHAFFKKRNKLSGIFAIFGLLIIIVYGSRNPLLAIFVYSIICLYDRKSNKRDSYGITIVVTVLLLMGVIYFNTFIKEASSTLESYGMSSRTVSLVMSSDTEDFSTGRNYIHNEVKTLIWNNPIVGTGICGDEANINELSHSLYLNIYATYGIIIGSIFLISIIWLTIKTLKISSGLEHQILVMYMCMVFPRGFTGGDMWGSEVFWWLIGIIFMILSNKQRVRRNAVSYIRKESVSVD